MLPTTFYGNHETTIDNKPFPKLAQEKPGQTNPRTFQDQRNPLDLRLESSTNLGELLYFINPQIPEISHFGEDSPKQNTVSGDIM